MKENRRNEGRVGGNQKLNLCMGIELNLCKKKTYIINQNDDYLK